MAIITALKAQKRNPQRINVYLDGEFSFGLSRIVAAWLHVGQELSDQKIAEIRSEDEKEVAMQKALHFINYRIRTKQEVVKKLEKEGFETNVVTEVVERLTQNRMIGDSNYASLWVESRVTFRPRSHHLMAMELRQKGVSETDIEMALAQAPSDEQLAYQAGNARLRRYASFDWQNFRKKLSAYLGRKGFSYGVLSPVVEQLWQELQASGEAEETSETDSSEI